MASITSKTSRQRLLKRLLDAVASVVAAHTDQSIAVDDWHVSFKLRKDGSRGDWYVTSPSGAKFASKSSLNSFFGLPQSVDADATQYPEVGQRVQVYWPGNHRYFNGRIVSSMVEHNTLIHRILYEDGKFRWHDFSTHDWRAIPPDSDLQASVDPAVERMACMLCTAIPRLQREVHQIT